MFYLATPPVVYSTILDHLSSAGLSVEQDGRFAQPLQIGCLQRTTPGERCVESVILRYPVGSTGTDGRIDQAGIISLGGFAAGETRYLQGWYRDPAGPCGGGFNFTNAMQVLLTP